MIARAAALLVAALALASAGLAGCGFTPMYAQNGAGGALSRIAVSTPDNRLGYGLREQLEDALAWDRGAQPALYRLDVAVEQNRRPLGRRIDDTSVRYELTVQAAWTLTPTAGGAPLTGVETTAVTYAAADQPYAGIAAQQDGEDRAVAELSRRLRLAIQTALAE
jgi:LPS-assembly lipoprotein